MHSPRIRALPSADSRTETRPTKVVSTATWTATAAGHWQESVSGTNQFFSDFPTWTHEARSGKAKSAWRQPQKGSGSCASKLRSCTTCIHVFAIGKMQQRLGNVPSQGLCSICARKKSADSCTMDPHTAPAICAPKKGIRAPL